MARARGGRVDVLIEEWKVIVEADGRAWHTRVADFEYDRWRDNEALRHGYTTVRFTWHQLVHQPRWCRTVLLAAATGHRRSGWDGSFRAA